MLAGRGALPPEFFGRQIAIRPAGPADHHDAPLVLVVANFVDLSSIASVGSAVLVIVFVLVGAAGYQRRAETGSNTVVAPARPLSE